MSTGKESSMTEADRRVAQRTRDPPGQRCVYIAPGDTRREIYRLSTFKNFPSQVFVDPCQLAANGFYYTGYKDRVKCYSCGLTMDKWQPGDDPSSSRWHSSDCSFHHGKCSENIPIHSHFTRLGFPSRSASRTQTRYEPTSSYRSEESAAANSSAVSSLPLQTSRLSINETTPQRRSANSQVNDTNGTGSHCTPNSFRCPNPINPHMRSVEARLQTFTDNITRWPAHRINATPAEIAEAGMYFLGEHDRVKCWYCNGGLQNWKVDDIPWTEHAKWFPLCEFLLQTKGLQFVQEVVDQYPNLRRPSLHNPARTSLRIPGYQPAFANALENMVTTPSRAATANPAIVDPKQEQIQRNNKIDDEMKSSPLVAKAKLMGFSEDAIKAALRRQYEQFDEGFSSLENLIDALVSSEDEDESVGMRNLPVSRDNLQAANPQEMEATMTCKVCHIEQANIVYIPCGHLIVCKRCSEHQKRCLLCRSFIRQKVRSYIC